MDYYCKDNFLLVLLGTGLWKIYEKGTKPMTKVQKSSQVYVRLN